MIQNPIESGGAPAPGLTAREFRSSLKPIWCPGCGDHGVLSALCRALAAIGRPPHEIAFISGIGCSSRIPGYTSAYGFNSVHGRALPIAQGVKLANPDLLVLVASGDGDAFSIGGGHVPHAIRRNPDITFLVMDNQVYGLTKGQTSPTTASGAKSPASAYASTETPVNPILYALAYGCNFVAQGSAADPAGLAALIEAGIRYPGFAFINILSPCVTFGDAELQAKALKERIRPLPAEGHDETDLQGALQRAQAHGRTLHTGVFYRNPEPPPTQEARIRELRVRGPALGPADALR